MEIKLHVFLILALELPHCHSRHVIYIYSTFYVFLISVSEALSI
jgi:hypothetical protein